MYGCPDKSLRAMIISMTSLFAGMIFHLQRGRLRKSYSDVLRDLSCEPNVRQSLTRHLPTKKNLGTDHNVDQSSDWTNPFVQTTNLFPSSDLIAGCCVLRGILTCESVALIATSPSAGRSLLASSHLTKTFFFGLINIYYSHAWSQSNPFWRW